jgi:large subunit ribosomal protein L21
MSYAIIAVGGKQYRVREGERLLVDRLPTDEGKTFNPRVLLVGGNGSTDLEPTSTVTARVVGHVLGEKIRIGKYKKRTGYRLHNGYRSRLTQIEIEAIGAGGRKAAPKKETPKAEAAPKVEAPKVETPKVEAPKVETPKVEAAPKAEAPKAEAPARTAHPPKDYESLTVAQIAEAAHGWRRPNLEAALEYEREHANRKGAIAALESAIASKEEAS